MEDRFISTANNRSMASKFGVGSSSVAVLVELVVVIILV